MPTREQLLNWGIRTKESIDLGDGITLTIRQLNAAELQQARAVGEKLREDSVEENLALCVAILCRSAVNEDGSRIFADGDERTLAEEFSYQRLSKLVDPVFRLNGLLGEQAEETAKN